MDPKQSEPRGEAPLPPSHKGLCVSLHELSLSMPVPMGIRILDIGVRDLVALGYSIPGRTSQKRGWTGACGCLRSVSHVVGPGQGSGLMGWVGSRQGTSGSPMVPYRSVQPMYTDMGQSSDPSGIVRSHQAMSGSDRFPSEH